LKKLERSPDSYQLYETFDHDAGGFERRRCPEWAEEEIYHIEQMIEEELLKRNEVRDAPHLGWEDDLFAESYIRPTAAGHRFVVENAVPQKWLRNVLHNLPTVITSVISALVVAYALQIFGLTK
jgi:hypothetical protein